MSKYQRGVQSEQARREGVNRSTISRRVNADKQDLSRTQNDVNTQKHIEKMREQLGGGKPNE